MVEHNSCKKFTHLFSRSRFHTQSHWVLVPDKHVFSTSNSLYCFEWIYSDNRCYTRSYTVACWPSNDGCHAQSSPDQPGDNNLCFGWILLIQTRNVDVDQIRLFRKISRQVVRMVWFSRTNWLTTQHGSDNRWTGNKFCIAVLRFWSQLMIARAI